VEFCFVAPTASKVAVAGTFNSWQPTLQLTKDQQGCWRARHRFDVYTAASVEYKFVINDKDWHYDPSKPTVKDKSGNTNN
jgi:1,4-alpha-glucan branching enzyme